MFDYHLARRLVRRYLKTAGFKGDFRVCTRPSTFDRYKRLRGETLTIDEKLDYAIVIPDRPPVFWVNLATNRTLEELHDSAAHEVIHVKHRRLGHGPEFDCRVRNLKQLV